MPLPIESLAIPDYTAALLPVLDALELDHVNVDGSHAVASISAELAIVAPTRVRRIVRNGLGVF